MANIEGENVSGKLLQHFCSYRYLGSLVNQTDGIFLNTLSDQNFLTLATLPSTMFKFIEKSEIKKAFVSIGSTRAVLLFEALNDVFIEQLEERIEKLKNKAYVTQYEIDGEEILWLNETIELRTQMLNSFLELIKQSHRTPFELLAKLI